MFVSILSVSSFLVRIAALIWAGWIMLATGLTSVLMPVYGDSMADTIMTMLLCVPMAYIMAMHAVRPLFSSLVADVREAL